MKLTHITMCYYPIYGGQEAYIEDLNRIFRKAGIEISVIQSITSKSRIKPSFVHYLPQLRIVGRFIKGAGWFWFNGMLSFKKRFLKSQDLLISHYPFHFPAVAWHKNVVVLSHAFDWPEPPKLLFDRYKKYAAELARKKGVKIVSNDTSFLRVLGIRAEVGRKFFEEVEENVWFIPNCVDNKKFCIQDRRREKVILLPRNIRKAKGIHLAIEAFRLFSERQPGFSLKIVGGPLSGEYYAYCLNLVKQYSLENSVYFAGHVANEDMVGVYNAAKITLIPTIRFEGTSLSALESMACGTPVVSTEVGGLGDLPSWKAQISPEDICDGLLYVLHNWDRESERQQRETVSVFNMDNWAAAWLRVISPQALSERFSYEGKST